MKIMEYDLYLFSCLLKLHDKDFEQLEYGLQFEQLPKRYDDFANSTYNDGSIGLYECIENYLTATYHN
jgi:hypothetical protein